MKTNTIKDMKHFLNNYIKNPNDRTRTQLISILNVYMIEKHSSYKLQEVLDNANEIIKNNNPESSQYRKLIDLIVNNSLTNGEADPQETDGLPRR